MTRNKTGFPFFIVLLSALLFNSIMLHGQSQPARAFEEKGVELVKKASEKLRSFGSVKIDFTYEMNNTNLDIRETMSGTLVSKGDKYHMKVGSNLFISDGTTMWSYLDDLDEVHISLVENSEGAITPTSILEEFDAQFRATFIRQEQTQGKTVDIIDLVPTTPQVFFKYRLAIDARNHLMVYAIAQDRQGGTYTYTINKLEQNPGVSDSMFIFPLSAYPGVEIIDLR